jgi:hypothetical protein
MTGERSLWEKDELDAFSIDSARSALDELFLLAKQYRDSSKFLDLMRFVARFRRYSAFNAMLVHIQMPGARYVLPAKRWLKEYHRVPVEGAQPLVMLQPMSPVMFGFDVSQTEGEALPAGFEDPFGFDGRLEEEVLTRTIDNARRDGVDVQMRPLGSTLGGYVRNVDSPHHVVGLGLVQQSTRTLRVDSRAVPVITDIVLNKNLSDEASYATLTHELGHLYCGHVGTPNSKWWPAREKLSRACKEFEAESVSYLVCRRANLATPAAEYLHGYLQANAQIPMISLDVLFKAVQRVEAMGSKKLPIRSSDEGVMLG